MSALWAWVTTHPWAVTAIVLYLIVNVAPRPHGSEASGWKAVLWETLDRLAILTSGAIPGKFKMLLVQTKLPAPATATDTADAQKEKIDGRE
jgi:hypothetical protein